MKSLIITPVGNKIPTDQRWNEADHWRWTYNDRDYETLAIVYNDFTPEEGSYDYILKMKGHKWPLIRDIRSIFPIDDYDYIGCVDDDLITNYYSFNAGLELAKAFNFQYWQLSMPDYSDLHPSYRNCLQQDSKCTFAETTFIEMGSPFFKRDRFMFLIDFLKHFELKIAWGIDKTFYDLFQCPSHVVHCAAIYQPIRESYYDKSEAMFEMNKYLYEDYPRVVREVYNREPNFIDRQVTLKKYLVEGFYE